MSAEDFNNRRISRRQTTARVVRRVYPLTSGVSMTVNGNGVTVYFPWDELERLKEEHK